MLEKTEKIKKTAREKFNETFWWACERWVERHLLFYWIKENKTEFVEKILEESLQEKNRKSGNDSNITKLIRKKILDAYSDIDKKVRKLLKEENEETNIIMQEQYVRWAIMFIPITKNVFAKKGLKFTIDDVGCAERSYPIFTKYLKREEKKRSSEKRTLEVIAKAALKSEVNNRYRKRIGLYNSLTQIKPDIDNSLKEVLSIFISGQKDIFPSGLSDSLIQSDPLFVDAFAKIIKSNWNLAEKVFRTICLFCIESKLTFIQYRILMLRFNGLRNIDIAKELGIKESTVCGHLKAGYGNLAECIYELQ